jgi:hypothetical protein
MRLTLPERAKGEKAITIILDVKLLLNPKEQRRCEMYRQFQVPCFMRVSRVHEPFRVLTALLSLVVRISRISCAIARS